MAAGRICLKTMFLLSSVNTSSAPHVIARPSWSMRRSPAAMQCLNGSYTSSADTVMRIGAQPSSPSSLAAVDAYMAPFPRRGNSRTTAVGSRPYSFIMSRNSSGSAAWRGGRMA
ncbi:surface protease GP63 [Trypanosoma cruzi]|nr:surface protease GP63 [Trypanosoma cruzi]